MSNAQETLIKAYRILASLPGADGKPFGDLALLAIMWPYVVILDDGTVIPQSLASELERPPKELLQSRRVIVVASRTHVAPLLDALGEQYVEVSKSPPTLLWYPSDKYERRVVDFAECADRVWSGLDCDDKNYALLALVSMEIMKKEIELARRRRES